MTTAPPAARTGLLSVVLGLLFSLAGTSTSGVTVALPSLAEGLGVTTADATWMVSGYAVALAVATPVHGRLADAVGIRAPLCTGTALLGLGALAPNFALLMVARVVQGLGAAAIPVLAAALLSARAPEERRGAVLGRLAGTSAVLSALGPLLGGALTTAGGWRAAVALPVVGLLALPYLWQRSVVDGDGARPDPAGALIVATAVSGLVLLIQSPSAGTAAAVTGAVLLAVGVPATAAWVRHRPDGFLPRAVVGNATVVRSSLCASAIPASWFALLLGIPLALAERGWTPLTTGLMLVPSAAVALACPALSARLQRRLGPTRTLLAACAATVAGLLAAVAGVAWHQPWVLAVAPMLVTLAFGTGQPAMIAAVGGRGTRGPAQRGDRRRDAVLPRRGRDRRRRHRRVRRRRRAGGGTGAAPGAAPVGIDRPPRRDPHDLTCTTGFGRDQAGAEAPLVLR
ncbi:putative CONSERVED TRANSMEMBRANE TRANSPORT PROTEIN [Pseudonocardia sp. Ae168_Ps1]|uniref:MFS transporter n=1 Tax=unclassified Pseudonocardia TaxID=2619320 RepID=UPI000968970B|nr:MULTISPECIES: MFS transporter [unclassified Pseudonocardia]OLL71345.1 putative CONSERVED TRANSMEMBRANE TRANSPORT PROTEIN [Pseudonocardia sp. Ae168_Ps1]OLL77104.1 putative CONSERVED TRANSMEMBRANE TRANSPORT PROTEIN [Pseudonocardia sp. Ae150A_Ps1]OLL88788.1 putative CONSERVED TRANSMEMBRANE TRANSPORT PROTEIN [Pseudonocardia sp. Ae263_Ps1]OLL91192.1 putative CONSERVED TRANSMEMBRANE TRANSPORT PROTEIN [Pseudonocardia sp. Ae356_Ps1]